VSHELRDTELLLRVGTSSIASLVFTVAGNRVAPLVHKADRSLLEKDCWQVVELKAVLRVVAGDKILLGGVLNQDRRWAGDLFCRPSLLFV